MWAAAATAMSPAAAAAWPPSRTQARGWREEHGDFMTAFSKLRGQKGKSHPPFVLLRQSARGLSVLVAKVSIGGRRGWPGPGDDDRVVT